MNSRPLICVNVTALTQILAITVLVATCGSCSQPNLDPSKKTEPDPNQATKPDVTSPEPLQATRSRQVESPKSFAAWFADGATALEEGDNETAVTAYTKAIEIDPISSETLNARGVAFLRMNRLSLALKDFNVAIELSPQVPKYYGNRAIVYGDKDEYTRSIADLTVAIELDPESPEWYRQRSTAYLIQGDDAKSKADALKADRLENPSLVTNSIESSSSPSTPQKKMGSSAAAPSASDLVKYQGVHDILEDIHEFTRLKRSSPKELRLLLDEMQKQLEELNANQSVGSRDPLYNAYSAAYALHDDACRAWDVYAKTGSLFEDAKTRWRSTVAQNAQAGIKSDPSLINEISTFTLIVEKGHIPITLFHSTSGTNTGLADIAQRHPKFAGEFNGYSFLFQHSIANFLKQSELLTSHLFPDSAIEETPPYGLSNAAPSQRLAARLQSNQLRAIVGDEADVQLFQNIERMRTIFKDWADRRGAMLKRAERLQGSKRDRFIQKFDKNVVKLLTDKYEITHVELDKIQALGAAQNWW